MQHDKVEGRKKYCEKSMLLNVLHSLSFLLKLFLAKRRLGKKVKRLKHPLRTSSPCAPTLSMLRSLITAT
jgi:hypothetical protein